MRGSPALKKVIQNSNFKKMAYLEEHRAQNEDRFSRGRQISKKIYEYSWVTDTHESIYDFSDMMSVTLRGDDVQSFDTRSNVSSGRIMESFYKKRICESDQLKTLLALYDQDVEQKDLRPSYQRFKCMVTKFSAQKSRTGNFEARNERSVTGAPAKIKCKRKSDSVEKKQEDCYQRNGKGRWTTGDACSFRHEDSKRGKRR